MICDSCHRLFVHPFGLPFNLSGLGFSHIGVEPPVGGPWRAGLLNTPQRLRQGRAHCGRISAGSTAAKPTTSPGSSTTLGSAARLARLPRLAVQPPRPLRCCQCSPANHAVVCSPASSRPKLQQATEALCGTLEQDGEDARRRQPSCGRTWRPKCPSTKKSVSTA